MQAHKRRFRAAMRGVPHSVKQLCMIIGILMTGLKPPLHGKGMLCGPL